MVAPLLEGGGDWWLVMVRRSLFVLVLLVLVVVLVGCPTTDVPFVSGVVIDQGDIVLQVGETATLSATVTAAFGASTAVEWSSEDESIATVSDEGVVSGVAEGEAVISATSSFDDSRSASIAVTVVVGDVNGDVVYEFEPPVEIGSEATEVRVDDARVLLPGVVPGTSSSVQVAVSDAPVGGRAGLEQLSSVVAVRLSGDRAFVSDDPDGVPMLQVTLPVRGGSAAAAHRSATLLAPFVIVRTLLPDGGYSDLVGQASWDDDVGAYTATVADTRSVCVGAASSSDDCESAWWVADATPITERENRVSSVNSAGSIGPADMRFRAGLHKVDAAAFAAAGGVCDTSEATWPWLTHDSDAHLWLRSADTALVFTHGWMVVAGVLEGLGGDDLPALPTHCTTWKSFLYRIGQAGSGADDLWARIRTGADVFTYRYNTNDRVAVAAEDYADRLQRLRDAGYKRIILVGHSLGGLVAHDARQRALSSAAWSGFGTSDVRVVTLATPYMGGPILCTAAAGGRCVSAVSPSLSLAWGLSPIDGLESTLDLAAALNLTLAQRITAGHVRIDPGSWLPLPRPFVRNPYLLELWDRVDLDDRNTLAFVGSSGERPFIADGMYSSVAGVLDGAWGYTDGIVPIASAVAATDLHRTVPRARLAAVSFTGRDHTYMASGCPSSVAGCPATERAGDPHLDNVARGIASWLATEVPSVDVSLAPTSVTLPVNGSASFTATVSGVSDTSVTWEASCGSISGSGSSVTYTAPGSAASCLVTATSVADPAVSATARVTVRSGGELALVSLDGNLAVLEVDGSLTSVRDTPATLTHGIWDSSRTRFLITERISDGGSDHRVIEFDDEGAIVGDDRVLLVPPPAAGSWSRSFGWHPDGTSVLYREREMRHCDHTSVMRRYPDGTETVFLDPAWVGDVIVYSLDIHSNGREVLWTSQVGCWSPTLAVFRADLVDGAVDVDSIEVLLDDGQHVDFARFSPDGSLIAFMRSDASRGYNGPENLYVMNVDGSGVRALTNNSSSAQRVRTLAWSADSETLLFSMSTDTGSTYEVYEASVSEPGAVQLTNASGRALVLDW